MKEKIHRYNYVIKIAFGLNRLLEIQIVKILHFGWNFKAPSQLRQMYMNRWQHQLVGACMLSELGE